MIKNYKEYYNFEEGENVTITADFINYLEELKEEPENVLYSVLNALESNAKAWEEDRDYVCGLNVAITIVKQHLEKVGM